MAFSPSGGLLATANYGDDTVSVFSVSIGGALTPVAGSPFMTGDNPATVAFSPSGGLLATANFGDNTVSVFSVSAGGALTPVAGSPFTTGSGPVSVAFSPSGGLLATANFYGGTVSVFSVSVGGALTAVAGSPFPTGTNPVSVAFSPSGGLLATANSRQHRVGVLGLGGRRAHPGHRAPRLTTGRGPTSVAFSPSGALLATANYDDSTVSVFSVSAGGALTPVAGSPFTAGRGPFSVAFSPSGGLLATANATEDNVSMFAPTGGFVIAKVADPNEVAPGRVLSYTITLRAAGVAGASGSVTDDLSGVLDKADYRNDAQASTGTVMFDAATKQLVWTGTLDPVAQATITYSVRIHGSAVGLVSNRVDGSPGSSCASPLTAGAAVHHRHADRQAACAGRRSGADQDRLERDRPPRRPGELRARGAEPRPGRGDRGDGPGSGPVGVVPAVGAAEPGDVHAHCRSAGMPARITRQRRPGAGVGD